MANALPRYHVDISGHRVRVYRDGMIRFDTSGGKALERAKEYLETHDPLLLSVRSGMLATMDPGRCALRPQDCEFALDPQILCPKRGRRFDGERLYYACTGQADKMERGGQ